MAEKKPKLVGPLVNKLLSDSFKRKKMGWINTDLMLWAQKMSRMGMSPWEYRHDCAALWLRTAPGADRIYWRWSFHQTCRSTL